MAGKTNTIFVLLLAVALVAFAAVVIVSLSSYGVNPSDNGFSEGKIKATGPGENENKGGGENQGPPARPDKKPAKLKGTGTITGRVTNIEGNPVEGVKILSNSQPGLDISTETGPDGTYALKNIPAGVYQIEAERSGFAVAEAEGIEVEEGGVASDVDFVLHTGGGIRISVFGTGSLPVSGVKVMLIPAGESDSKTARPARRTNSTGDDGVATFQFVPAGAWKIRVRHGAYLAPKEDMVIDVADGAGYSREVTLDRGSSVSGFITDDDGNPVPGARVTIKADALAQGGRVFTKVVPRSGADGSFNFPALEPADYEITAQANGFLADSPQKARVGIAEDVKNISITVRRGLSISGRCKTESGEPLAGVRVYAYQGSRNSNAETDNAGEFFVQGLENQPCRVQAYLRGFQTGRLEAVQPGTKDLEIILKPRGSSGEEPPDNPPPSRRRFDRGSGIGRNRGEGEPRQSPNRPPEPAPAPQPAPESENNSGE